MGDTTIEIVLFKIIRKMCGTGDPSEVNAYGESISIIQQTFDEIFPAPIDKEEK